jgi:hypothetical protein
MVKLVASRTARLEPRRKEVDQAFRVAELGRRHLVEVAMAEDFPTAIGIRGNDDRVVRTLVLAVVADRDRRSGDIGSRCGAFLSSFGIDQPFAVADIGPIVALPVGRARPFAAEVRSALSPEGIEHPVVRLPIVPPSDEDRRAGSPDLVADADVD